MALVGTPPVAGAGAQGSELGEAQVPAVLEVVNALATRLDSKQLLDVLITSGGYGMVSMALNTFGVQLEPGAERFPSEGKN